MKTIPKTSKVKTSFYKNFTFTDLFIALIALFIMTITITSKIEFKWTLFIIELSLIIPLFISFDNEKLYMIIWNLFVYLISTKVYKNNKENSICSITPYKEIKNNFVINNDDSYSAVIEISPIDLRVLSEEKQQFYINEVFTKILNLSQTGDAVHIVKLEKQLILDKNIEDEMKRIEQLSKLNYEGDLSFDELEPRLNIIEDRLQTIDILNSSSNIINNNFYLVLTSNNSVELENNISRIISLFMSNGMIAKRLLDKELSVFLRFNISSDDDERELLESNDISIYPEEIKFNFKNYVLNNKYSVSNFVIKGFPSYVGYAWAESLYNIPNTKIIMKLKPVEKSKALKRIDSSIAELSSKLDKVKTSEAVSNQIHLDSLNELLFYIQNDNEILFDTSIYISVYDEFGSLDNKKKVKSKLRELGFIIDEMFGKQFECYISNQYSIVEKTNISRGIPSSVVSSSFPFVSNRMMDNKGILIGENEKPVFIDFFKRDKEFVNSNLLIVGKSGSGKSYASKSIISSLSTIDSKIFILDPENEYQKIADNLNGISINTSNNSEGMINPFQIMLSIGNESNSYFEHIQFLEVFFKILLPNMEDYCFELLNECIQDLYRTFNITSKTKFSNLTENDYPTFSDLYELIVSKSEKERDDCDEYYLRTLYRYIHKFVDEGVYSSLWNGHSTFSPKEHFVNFNFQSLFSSKNDIVANAQMLLILKWIENEILKNREFNKQHKTKRKIIVVVDEAHLFIDEKYPVALDFMYQLAKRIRKYDGMLIIITQSIKDFVTTQAMAKKTMAILSATQYSMIFNLNTHDANELRELYKGDNQINDYEMDTIINNPRGQVFMIASPNKRTIFNVFATEYLERLFE